MSEAGSRRRTREPDTRPWYAKKRYGIPAALLTLLVVLLIGVGATTDTPIEPVAAEVVTEVVTHTATETVTEIVTETPTAEPPEIVAERQRLNRVRQNLNERKARLDDRKARLDERDAELDARARELRRAAAREPDPETASDCHPSYEPCLPIVSDVDCAGGSGDGPEYTGQVSVIGSDEYDLDRDGDGVGCD